MPIVPADSNFDDRTLTIREFCFAENISPAVYYKRRKLGLGPREMRFPGSSMVRITAEARREWKARMEAVNRDQQEKLAAEREARVGRAVRAGSIAAQSPAHVSRQR